jgi:hypothetical protein
MMLMEHVADQGEVVVDVSGLLAIAWLNSTDRRGCEAKLPCQRGMKDQHVPDIDIEGRATHGTPRGIGGATPGVSDGIFPAAVGMTVRAERRSAVDLSHRPSLSLEFPS